MIIPADQTIYLIGGTTEANRATARLRREGYKVTLSVTTLMGARIAAATDGQMADIGCKDAERMARRATDVGASAIIDCSHPFADTASVEARSAAARAGLPYLRFCRPPVELDQVSAIRAESWSEAVQILSDRAGRALLSVGTRNLEPFVREGISFTARILPLPESLFECERLGIEPQNLIAAHPPFGVDFNRACIRHAGADILVTKESGHEGGLLEKAEAALAERIDILIIDRPPDPGAIHELDILVSTLQDILSS